MPPTLDEVRQRCRDGYYGDITTPHWDDPEEDAAMARLEVFRRDLQGALMPRRLLDADIRAMEAEAEGVVKGQEIPRAPLGSALFLDRFTVLARQFQEALDSDPTDALGIPDEAATAEVIGRLTGLDPFLITYRVAASGLFGLFLGGQMVYPVWQLWKDPQAEFYETIPGLDLVLLTMGEAPFEVIAQFLREPCGSLGGFTPLGLLRARAGTITGVRDICDAAWNAVVEAMQQPEEEDDE